MVAREHRIFFIVTPSLLAIHASDVHFTCPCSRRDVLAIEWAHRDLITKVSVRGKRRQINTIWGTHMVYLNTIGRAFLQED